MRNFKSIAATAVAGVILASIAGAAGKKIVLEGSTTVLPIAQRAAEEFMDKNPQVNMTVRGGGSGVGITSLIDGTCDIANASRAMKDAELQKAAGKGRSPKAHVIAMDGIVLIVNKDNDLANITKKQIQDIFTGKISNWSKLGLSSEKIVVVSRDSASGTYEAFGELALNKMKVRPDALMQASNQAIAQTVAGTPGAIGYVGMGYVSDSVKTLTVNGIDATKQTVLSGKYPLSRPLFMYTNDAASGDVKNFIDFVKSKEGQKIVEEEGFVALK